MVPMNMFGVMFLVIFAPRIHAQSVVGFEKLTEYEYRGNPYFTIKNLSLHDCQGWCREEAECQAATFSFLVNPLVPIQQTICLLHNETFANNPTSTPHRVQNTYYMTKLRIRSDNVCPRAWIFERVPNKMIRGLDKALIFTSTKEACFAACLNEKRFVCRSIEYTYSTLKCHLSEYDRRSVEENVDFIDSAGVDYFENLCLKENEACKGQRRFVVPQLGIPEAKISQYVILNYYADRELLASNHIACERACMVEGEFLCRSYLFKGPMDSSSHNCKLFHQDHQMFPDSTNTYMNVERPLIDTGGTSGMYYENICLRENEVTTPGMARTPATSPPTSQIAHDPNASQSDTQNGNFDPQQCDTAGICYNVIVSCTDTKIQVDFETNRAFNGRIYALGRAETCNVDVINSDKFRIDLSLFGQDCNTQSASGSYSNVLVIQHHSVVMTKIDKMYKIKCVYDTTPINVTFGMLPIRDPDMISVASAPESPAPRIVLLDQAGKEVESVRVGDRVTLRIDIPDNSKQNVFLGVRSLRATTMDSRSASVWEDLVSCPVDPTIFPQFTSEGSALHSTYEAFRFTESYGVIFQCTVRYCLGSCEPAQCKWNIQHFKSWGRRRRSVKHSEDMTLSQEIIVFDMDETAQSKYLRQKKGLGELEKPSTIIYETCPTKLSVLALSVTCALLILIYLCTVFHFVMRKYLKPKNKLLH